MNMSKIEFSMDSVTERRKRTSIRSRSIYDPIIEKFLEGDAKLVEIQVQGKKGSYVKTQLSRRIKSRKLDLTVESVGDYVYLERP
ncbi:unnamed protein product [marine sediment metagenome]|uniref:Uncharacterized protein n=1 Tax=marine sediment metagenome TaxID=412755 RepID=X1D9C7_9ZZZZ